MIGTFVITLYFLLLVVLAIFGAHRYYNLSIYLKTRNQKIEPKGYFEELPPVTVQIPVYNEKYVIARVIDAVCRLDYPKEKLQIQVLDDSTDDTTAIAAEKVRFYKAQGFDIELYHRNHRKGYKAGALEDGLKVAKGDFIAIFDADFVPPRDFLKKIIHYFTDPKVGMVQARWGHINRSTNLLTKVQSIFLDGHFLIEHVARNRSGRFFNFNGTAGIWRKEAIFDAGGWEHDTLTEDIDLSYRAQMKGWKFIYLPEIVVPAELPVDIHAFKTQQHRWAKGAMQVAKKLLPVIFRSNLRFDIKAEAFFHMCGNIAYLLMVPFSLLVFPVMLLRRGLGLEKLIIIDAPLFILATASVGAFYLVTIKDLYKDWPSMVKYLPALMAIGIGLAVNNAWAVVEALLDKPSEFERTPKYGIVSEKQDWRRKIYKGRRTWVTWIELLLAVYFNFAVYSAIKHGVFVSLPFVMLFQYGYTYMATLSIIQMLDLARGKEQVLETK